MRLEGGHRKARWWVGLAAVGVVAMGVLAGAASLLMASRGEPPRQPEDSANPEVSANDAIAARFPSEWEGAEPLTAAAYALASLQQPEVLAKASTLDWMTSPLVFDQARLGLASLPPYSVPEAGLPEGADVVLPRPRNVPGDKATLFTERQIASIKERLKLTQDQEELWPSVEAALRAITWRGSRAKLNHKNATLDPKSLEKIATTLGPFLKKLRNDQKDELRSIAHVMGLEQLASQL